ncbi:MAG: TIGR03617 family F420-dependent LLM class oxidoreductase [Chloroflexota bacterium]
MLLDAALPPVPLSDVPEIARHAEKIGFDALWSSETSHDPFLSAALISEHSQRLRFGTAIAVSFARSPTTIAYTAWDLAQFSNGRFILGLGTQVKAHIERRFGMPWPDSVVGKLREQIQAMHALWSCWQENAPLNFRGEYYRLSLMTPFFNPGPIPQPNIPIFIAGVNRGLARLAGEVADGFLVHPFHSVSYLQQVLLPSLQGGAQQANRSPTDVQISVTAFTVTNSEEADFARFQLAFYASTPSYRAVMTHHGWEAAAEELSALASRGRWGEMPALITDEMLETFAVVSDGKSLSGALHQRYEGVAHRLCLYLPFTPGLRDDFWRNLVKELQPA